MLWLTQFWLPIHISFSIIISISQKLNGTGRATIFGEVKLTIGKGMIVVGIGGVKIVPGFRYKCAGKGEIHSFVHNVWFTQATNFQEDLPKTQFSRFSYSLLHSKAFINDVSISFLFALSVMTWNVMLPCVL